MKQKYIIVLLLLLAAGCRVNRLNNVGIQDAYDSKANFTDLAHVVYHVSDHVSRVYFRLNTSGLLYMKKINDQMFRANYRIHYELYNMSDTKNLADSASLSCIDTVNYILRRPVVDSLDLNISAPGRYTLELTITDLNRKNSSTTYIDIRKDDPEGRQNYLIRDTSGAIIFTSHLSADQCIRIHLANKRVPRLFVRYYDQEFTVAPLPFIESRDKSISLKADSMYFIEINDGHSGELNFQKKGIYFIQTDTMQKTGLALFRFHKDFPEVTSAEQMLAPLVYISTRTEFNDMKMMKNTKDAVDNFWLEKSGNPDRAKEMIRRYYTRVIDANRFFTSYLEGWKTDRGLIYVVYGPPNLVYISPSSETWLYGEDRNILSMTFVFNRIENPLTNNDYSLVRTQEYKDTWYTAVDAWRN